MKVSKDKDEHFHLYNSSWILHMYSTYHSSPFITTIVELHQTHKGGKKELLKLKSEIASHFWSQTLPECYRIERRNTSTLKKLRFSTRTQLPWWWSPSTSNDFPSQGKTVWFICLSPCLPFQCIITIIIFSSQLMKFSFSQVLLVLLYHFKIWPPMASVNHNTADEFHPI